MHQVQRVEFCSCNVAPLCCRQKWLPLGAARRPAFSGIRLGNRHANWDYVVWGVRREYDLAGLEVQALHDMEENRSDAAFRQWDGVELPDE